MSKPASDVAITEVPAPPELEKRIRWVFSAEYKLKILAEAQRRCAAPVGSSFPSSTQTMV